MIIIDVLRRAGADVTVASVEESLQVNKVSGSPNETLETILELALAIVTITANL